LKRVLLMHQRPSHLYYLLFWLPKTPSCSKTERSPP
jgi:hypothetical protein